MDKISRAYDIGIGVDNGSPKRYLATKSRQNVTTKLLNRGVEIVFLVLMVCLGPKLAAADEQIQGAIVLTRPAPQTISLSGTINERGEVKLQASSGVQSVGQVTVSKGDFTAFMYNLAPAGKTFADGSDRMPFNVRGKVIDGVMAGKFSDKEVGIFILCSLVTAEKHPVECSGTSHASVIGQGSANFDRPVAPDASRKNNHTGQPSKATRRFFDAIVNGNLEMASLALREGADINCQRCNPAYDTPLIVAAVATVSGNRSLNPVVTRHSVSNVMDAI